MAIVGPGAQQEALDDVKPLLHGASEYEYVTILNPLSDDFAVRVAQDIPVNMPMQIRSVTGGVQAEGDLLRTYGDTFKNPDFKGRKHIINDTVIKAGQTVNLKGNEAQVAVKQLVDEILQREGNKRLLADPTLRRRVEERIIQRRGSIQDLMDSGLRSTRNQIDEAINKSNEVQDEPAFPGIIQSTAGGEETAQGSFDTGTDNPTSTKRSPGRPKKD